MSHVQTLESLVSRYRRSTTDPSLAKAEIELEVRFRGIDFYIFDTVLKALISKDGDFAIDDGVVVHTINSIMDEEPVMRHPRQRGATNGQKINLIRQLTFDNTAAGKRIGDRFYRKWSLTAPYRIHNPHALSYSIVLSAEEDMSESFTSDAGAIIRAKSRASFTHPIDSGGAWRIDLTVTRTLRGVDASTALQSIVTKMFRAGKMTPANMLALLNLTDPDSKYRSLYDYEIEIEYLPDKVGGADDLRPSGITSFVASVLKLANPEYIKDAAYQSEIFYVAGFIVDAPGLLRRFEYEWGLKKLVPQVTALTRSEYKDIYPPTGYFLLDKADGIRAIASVRDGHLRILADELLEFYAPGYGPEPKDRVAMRCSKSDTRITSSTIVDGELVRGPNGKKTFYAFDVIAVLGENVSTNGYEVRVARLEEAVGVLREFDIDAHMKPIVHLTGSEPTELKVQFLSQDFKNLPYTTDGRILVEPGKSYSDTIAYKWKPLWDTTIDFLARRAPPSILGHHPYVDAPGHELHLLFVGINPDLYNTLGLERLPGYQELFGERYGSYFPIQFSPSDAPLAYLYQHPIEKPKKIQHGWEGWIRDIDGKVVEMRCVGTGEGGTIMGDLGTPNWQIARIREDRTREIKTQQYFGNDARIAELTWLNYLDPFLEEQLWEGAMTGYFSSPKSAIYRAQTAFTSFVKSQRIESTLSHATWVVDAAIGKGQDFGRYIKAAVRHVVGIDQDSGALSELVRRKFSHARATKGRRGNKDPTTLFVLRADLTSPHDEIAAKVRTIVGYPGPQEAEGADALVINLAIHYLTGNVINIRNFAALCRDLVKVGGTIIITAMFGQRVYDLLASQNIKPGESWDSRQDGVLKYSIRRDYTTNHLTKAGQIIGVLLPFSNGKYYEEYLVNVDWLIAEFSTRGFTVVSTPTFDAFFDEFRTRNPTMHNTLTAADLEFLSLYGEIILKREK